VHGDDAWWTPPVALPPDAVADATALWTRSPRARHTAYAMAVASNTIEEMD